MEIINPKSFPHSVAITVMYTKNDKEVFKDNVNTSILAVHLLTSANDGTIVKVLVNYFVSLHWIWTTFHPFPWERQKMARVL
jgi:putative flippase GtrA